MADLLINKTKISSNVIPNITLAKTYMNNSQTHIKNTLKYLPSDFSSRSTVLNIQSEMGYLKEDIENLFTYFNSTVNSINSLKSESQLKTSPWNISIETIDSLNKKNNTNTSENTIAYTTAQNVYDTEMSNFINSSEYYEITAEDAQIELTKYMNSQIHYTEHGSYYKSDLSKKYHNEIQKFSEDEIKLIYYYFQNHTEDETKEFMDKVSLINDKNYADMVNSEEYKKAAQIEYENMSWWEKASTNAKVFFGSFVERVADHAESVVDACAGTVALVASAFHFDTSGIEDFINHDYSAEAYSDFVRMNNINYYAAYGKVHDVGNFVGSVTTYAALICFFGPNVATVVGALDADGSAVERALNSGATFVEAEVNGKIAGVFGLLSGALTGHQGNLAKGSTSLKQVSWYTTVGFFSSAAEPFINSLAEYKLYAGDMVDEEGNKVYSSFWDYYVNSGGLTNSALAGTIGAGSVFTQGVRSVSDVDKYKKEVSQTMESDYRWNSAKETYEAMNGKGSFKNLSDAERNKLMYSLDETAVSKQMAENQERINNSVKNTQNQYKKGTFNKKYTLGDILKGYKDEDQSIFLSKKGYKRWLGEYGKFADSEGNINVYSFQNGAKGANNITTFGGSTSSGKGSFVISEEQYKNFLANRELFDSRGNCIDSEKLGDLLGGVSFGDGANVIAVKQTIKLDDLKLTYGSHPNAYPGWYSQGTKTVTKSGVGYCTEAIAPHNHFRNGNVDIISHNTTYSAKYYTKHIMRSISE